MLPAIGDLRIDTVTRRDIVLSLDAICDHGAAVVANRALAETRRMFAFAVERGVIDASPFFGRPGKRRHRPLLLPASPGCRNRGNGRHGAYSVRFLQFLRHADMLTSLITTREVDHAMSSRLGAAGRATHPANVSGTVVLAHVRVSWRSHARPVFSSGAYIDAGPALGTSSVLADYVDGMADFDIACPDQAQALTLKAIPSTAPFVVVYYRTPIASTWQFGSRGFSQPDCRHFAAKLQTGVVVWRPRGPVGMIGVRLRPEAAACLLGERMHYFLDARIGLDGLFGTSRVSLLVEELAEARTSAERFACMEGFLAANLRERRLEPVACRAAALLRQNPHLRVRHLAARLDVSERHLSRSFHAMFGMRPKQFARIARIERVWSARGQGASWADIAYATRFTDQAHMINDFTEIVGVPPAQLVRPPYS